MRQLVKQVVYVMFITNNHLRFTCGERKFWQIIERSKYIMTMIVVELFVHLNLNSLICAVSL